MLILEIFIAGKYEAIAEISNEIIKIIIIELVLISLGNLSKKYISDGKISMLKTDNKNILNFSMFMENKTPRITPEIVAKKPIVKPVKKKVFLIDLLLKPSVLSIAISLVLFFINIVKQEIILKAATITINVRITNITFLSTFNALKSDLFRSDQEYTK